MNTEQQRALNRRIAERLGYHTRKAQRRTNLWHLVAPDGSSSLVIFETEDAALASIDYASSLDAVVAALPAEIHLYIHYEAENSFTVTLREKSGSRFWCREGATRPEAAAEALDALLTARKAEHLRET